MAGVSVYFIQAERTGLIKIGRTNGDVRKRKSQFLTGTPDRLKILAVEDGGDEKTIHGRFQGWMAFDRREWFLPCDELLSYIQRLPPFRDGWEPELRAALGPDGLPVYTAEKDMRCEMERVLVGIMADRSESMDLRRMILQRASASIGLSPGAVIAAFPERSEAAYDAVLRSVMGPGYGGILREVAAVVAGVPELKLDGLIKEAYGATLAIDQIVAGMVIDQEMKSVPANGPL